MDGKLDEIRGHTATWESALKLQVNRRLREKDLITEEMFLLAQERILRRGGARQRRQKGAPK